jgi:hypothetical protein
MQTTLLSPFAGLVAAAYFSASGERFAPQAVDYFGMVAAKF